MAAQAHGILLKNWRERFGTEINHARQRATPRFDVRAPRSVTRLALQAALAERALGIVRARMLAVE